MRKRRLPSEWLALLAAAGTLVGHFAAYSAVSGRGTGGVLGSVSHHYLYPLAAILFPAAAALLLRILALELRFGTRLFSFRHLALAQTSIFILQESIESLVEGRGLHVLSEPVFWVGIVAQLIVAGLLPGLVHGASRVLSRLWRRPRDLNVGITFHVQTASDLWRGTSSALSGSISKRGPPETAVTQSA